MPERRAPRSIAGCQRRDWNEESPEMIAPEVLLQGYRLGVFPMAMEDGAIEWFSPDPRAILPLNGFHVPHTLERAVRKKTFDVRFNVSFAEVMRECARRPET